MDGLICLRAQWDRVAAWVLIGLGALLVMSGGLQAREATDLADQLSFIMSGSLGGLIAGAAGAALLISAGLHDEWRVINRVEGSLPSRPDLHPPAEAEKTRGSLGRWLRAEWDRSLGWGLCGATVILVAVASRSLAATPWGAEQVAYLVSGGLGALLLLLLATALLLAADLRDTGDKLDIIDGSVPSTRPSGRSALLAGVLVAVGSVLVGLGWWRAADTLELLDALDGLVIAAVGLTLAAGALGGEVVSIRRRVAGRLNTLASRLTPGIEDASRAETDQHEGFWTTDGLRRFHRSSCPGLRFAAAVPRRVTAQTTLEPCRICIVGE